MSVICADCRNFSDDNIAYSGHKKVGLGICSLETSPGTFYSAAKKDKPCFVARKPLQITARPDSLQDGLF